MISYYCEKRIKNKIKKRTMKKFIITVVTVISCSLMTSCGGLGQVGLGSAGGIGSSSNTATSVFGALASSTGVSGTETSSLIGNIISTFAGGALTNQSTIVGTWTYKAPSVQFESESLLTKAGGSYAATQMESKLGGYYQMVGIKPGTFTFTFNKDNTCSYKIGSKTVKGTYTFDSNKKTITIKGQTGAALTAYVSVSVNELALTFDATKLLTLVSQAGTVSQSLSSISSLAGSFSGMKLGFKFGK